MFLINLAGTPATTVLASTSLVTTAPAPTTALSPICTPGRILAPAPIQTLSTYLYTLAHKNHLVLQIVIICGNDDVRTNHRSFTDGDTTDGHTGEAVVHENSACRSSSD
jgi:hypothetical protein